MNNSIHEGPGRLGRPDAEGVLNRQPTSAAEDLVAQIAKASAARATNASAAEIREISSITTRSELREAALAELSLRDPSAARVATWPGFPAGTAQKWADLDAAEFARLRAPDRREAAIEAMAATARQVPDYASELNARSHTIGRSVARYNDDLSQLQAEREARLQQAQGAVQITAQDGLKGDKAAEASQLQRLTIDADTLARLATVRAEQSQSAARALAADREIAASVAQAAELRASHTSAQAGQRDQATQTTRDAIQAATQAMLARRRAEDSREAAVALGILPESAQGRVAAPSDRPVATPEAFKARDVAATPAAPTAPGRAVEATQSPAEAAPAPAQLRRPVREEEVPDELRRRYLVTTEKAGLIDKGRTEFTFRGGDRDGQVAFADAGKQLTTRTEDKDVIRAMVTLAQSKGWHEVTVNGSDEFRRAAWLEGRMAGLQVHGYEAREADLKRLSELQADKLPTNAITAAGREPPRDQRPREERPREEQSLEALRARLVLELANPRPDREERQKLAHTPDARAQQAIRADGELRSERDMQTIRSMSAAQLKDLARLVDASPSAESERRIRQVLDGAARHEPAHSEPSGSQPSAEKASADKTTAATPSSNLAAKGVHVDGDSLTPKERKVMDGVAELLKGRGYGTEFVDATMAEFESRMRRQRVHVGELVEHGAAPYQGDRSKDMSYYVTLKTAAGLETVWGKRLGAAIKEGGVKEGDQIVLINTGKKAVDVTERTLGDNGQPTSRPKAAQLNEWSAQPIDRLTTLERDDVNRRVGREPALRVVDPHADRVPEHRRLERSHPPAPQRQLGFGRDHGAER